MENTNVEEESSDAAAYGLVALCDHGYEVLGGQLSEEIVETTDQIVTQDVDENTVKILIQNIDDDVHQGNVGGDGGADQNNDTANFETSTKDGMECEDLNNGNELSTPNVASVAAAVNFSGSQNAAIQFDGVTPTIAYVQGECANENEIDVSNLQAVAAAIERASGIKIEDVESAVASGVLSAIEGIEVQQDVSNPALTASQAAGITFEGLQSSNDSDEAKVLVSYQVDVLDEHYLQALKSRQALLREAIEWKLYARMLLEKGCSLGANFHEPEVLSVLKATEDVELKAEILSRITEKDMLQPAVQFWDFEKVYETHCNKKTLNCPSCSMSLTFVPFGQRFALRMLYDVDRPVLLVTSFLRCSSKGKKQHEILGYDPRLLRMFPNLDLPFMLFHKAGITKKMMEFILESIISGMTVNRLFDVVKTKYEVNHTITSQFFANEIETIRTHVMAEGGQVEISSDAMFPPYINCHPSKALLGRCFLAAFKEKDEYYKFCMEQLLAKECIVLDDSLSVGARIGFPGVWASTMKLFPEEFQGMFLVFNEAKHILTWTFLKENKFKEVEPILVELRDRHNRANSSLKACFTTKCCAWKDDLRKIFGKWFIVKGNLRLFLDQIIKEMPNDHTYYQDCVNELTLAFRVPNDTEEIRKEHTADPLVVSNNLQEFLKRWRDVIDDRIQAVLTEKAIELLVELEQHVKAGCLSGIPPEVGDDNFNEIHNTLRKSVSHCRITVPLVSALFSMCLHEVNRSKGAPTDFQYRSKAQNDPGNGSAASSSEIIKEKTMEGTSTVSIQTDMEEPQGTNPQLYVLEKQKHVQASTIIQRVQDHYSKNDRQISILLLQALMYYKYQEDFDAFAPQAIPNLRLLPYYSSALNLISHPAFPREEKLFDTKQISAGLLQMELKIRRLHVDIASSARLSGTVTDIFPIISRQLQKDKMCDNLSVDVLEYLKELLRMGVHLIDMKEKDLVASLKVLINYQSTQIGDIKKEILGNVNKALNPTTVTESSAVTKWSNNGVKETTQTSGDASNQQLLNDSTDVSTQTPSSRTTEDTSESAEMCGFSRDNVDDPNSLEFPTTKDPTVEAANTDIPIDSNTEPSIKTTDDVPMEEVENASVDSATADPTNQEDLISNAVAIGDKDMSNVTSENLPPSDFELLKSLADKLGAVITLFTELQHCWVIPIFPEKFSLNSPHFFVIYRFQRFFPAWLGSKASVSSIRNINLKRQGKEPQCRCGRGTPGKTGQGRCVSKENGKYLTRCICFRLDRGCGSLCDCRNCENPFGKRPERVRPKKSKIPYRQRYAHEAARIATCKSSSVSTTIATQTPNIPEAVDTDMGGMESWVPLEHCIFEALINEIKSDDNVITPSEVQDIFNAVVEEITSVPELSKVAYKKTTEQVSLKLQQREKDVSEYLKIYQMQVDLSLG